MARKAVAYLSFILFPCLSILFVPRSLAEPTVYYVHNDHRGAPVAMTDANQTVVWKASYLPFGEAIVDEDPDGDGELVTQDARLPGQYYDEESGLYYNYYRDYDPSLGRYVQSDPIGLADGLNTYTYVYGNPLRYVDRFGLDGGIDDEGYNGAAIPKKCPPLEPVTGSVSLPPLSREDADSMNKIAGHSNNLISTVAGMMAGRFGGGAVGTAAGLATSSALTETGTSYYPGDVVSHSYELSIDPYSDSGYQLNVITTVTPSNQKAKK